MAKEGMNNREPAPAVPKGQKRPADEPSTFDPRIGGSDLTRGQKNLGAPLDYAGSGKEIVQGFKKLDTFKIAEDE